jgi:phospholipase/carboxylesterase
MSLTTSIVRAKEHGSPFWMMVLHGLGDSMEGYQWFPDQMNLPWLNYALVNAPDPYFTGFSWFDIQGDHEEGIARNRQLLFQTIEKVCETEGIEPSHLFMFGFSQGCVMTIETGMRFPHLLAGLIGVSGFVHRPESLLAEAQPHAKTHPFLLTHGSFDAVIPHSPVEKQVDRLAEAGIRCQWKVFPKEHTIYGEVELQLYREFLEEIRAGLQPAEG